MPTNGLRQASQYQRVPEDFYDLEIHTVPAGQENKKFIYKVVKEGARAREYEDALQWLVDARLVHKIYRSCAPGLPVAAL